MRQAEIERQKQMDAQRNELGKGYLQIQKKMVDWQTDQPNPTATRRQDFEFNAAAQDASQGRFDNPDHVLSMYPTLTDQEANVMASRSVDARKGIQASYDTAANVADTLNKWNFLGRQVKTAQAGAQSAHSYTPWQTGAEKQAGDTLKTAQDALSQIAPIASRIQSDKRLNSLVVYDPDQDKYVPAIPSQPWMKQNQPAQPQQPQQPTMGPTQTGAVPIGGGNSIPMRGGSNAPMPATSSTGTNGYTPQHSAYVYNRVNELVSGGMDPASAKRRALAEDAALSAP